MQDGEIIYDSAPQKSNTTRNIIIAVAVLLLLCCCCAFLMIGLAAAAGVFGDLANQLGLSQLALNAAWPA